MMISLKAILLGTTATAAVFLFNQFIFIFVAGYAGVLLTDNTFWLENKEWIWQTMGLITLIVSMLLGGVMVSFLAKERKALHGLIVGVLISSIFILFARDLSKLNSLSVFIFLAGSLCTALAAHYTPSRSHSEEPQEE